ncbi:glycosyltransferase [Patescibacteria group bacterium]|nr:glycosyltransferase [Patescibacteria group bacterium]MCL5409405.1 glycosyltransferase [Patescibacteria group bacterium]
MHLSLVHDDLVQWGGAEKVLKTLSDIFPEAPIYTSVVDFANPMIKHNFAHKQIVTSFLQKIPSWKTFYRALLPLYPLAFEQFDFSEYDLVISQTTRFAKSIITKPDTKHICYCHTPPRFLWSYQNDQYLLLKPYFHYLKRYDKITASRVDYWLAGSKNAQQRIKDIYGVDSQVIYPFVEERLTDVSNFAGGYLLVISRLNRYKRVDLVIKAAQQLKLPLKIVGQGPEEGHLHSIAKGDIEFVGVVSQQLLERLVAGCKALVVAGVEDFGLTPIEAESFGKPVIAFGQGGALESVIDGQTGYLFDKQIVASLVEALLKLEEKGYNEKACLQKAQQFSKNKFTSEFTSLVKSYA